MLRLDYASERPLRILCLGAHSDDIEIGCGGTILRLIAQGRVAHVDWIVFSTNELRAAEARRGAEFFLEGAPSRHVEFLTFRDGFFPYQGAEVKGAIETVGRLGSPDIVFTHHKGDLHQDHRLLAELSWNTFRNHLILEYEIPKYDGNPYAPNHYVVLEEDICRRKVDGLFDAFTSQTQKPWFTADTFMATLRLRGMESASPTRFAEAFISRKTVV